MLIYLFFGEGVKKNCHGNKKIYERGPKLLYFLGGPFFSGGGVKNMVEHTFLLDGGPKFVFFEGVFPFYFGLSKKCWGRGCPFFF